MRDRSSLASLLLSARAINIIGLFSTSTPESVYAWRGSSVALLNSNHCESTQKHACRVVVLILVWLIFTISCLWSVYWMDDRARCNRPKVFPPISSISWIFGWMIPEITLEKIYSRYWQGLELNSFALPLGACLPLSSSSLPECPFTFLCPATSGGAIDSCFKLFPDDKIFVWCLRVVKSLWYCYY